MSTPMLTSFVSNNNETPTNKKQAASRINSAPIRTLTTTTTKFSSSSFTNLKQKSKQQNETLTTTTTPIERFTIDYVIKHGYFNLVRYLLDLGLDSNHVTRKDASNHMYTPLIYCTFIQDEKWSLSLAQNLLEHGADLKQTDSNSLNPIHYCCAFGLEDLLSLFLKSVDFDLSKALDSKGNNCMHYAIRSHNLNCVKLLIDQFKPNDMYKRINVKNSFGLRPSQIEDECDYSQLKYFNYKFNGKNTLDECKQELINFIREYTILKTLMAYKQMVEAKSIVDKNQEVANSKLKTSKLTKKRSGKVKVKKNSKSSSTSSTKSEFKGNFFQTEIEPIIEETKPSTAATSPKSKKKSSKSSLKKEITEKEIDDIKIESNQTSQPPELVVEPIIDEILNDDKDMNKEKAKQLTSKSFQINLKTRLENLINFNDIFVSKEYLFRSVLNATSLNEPIKLQRSSSLRPDNFSRTITDINKSDVLTTYAGGVDTVKTWKTQLPSMFLNLECLLTPSYRDTVQPMSMSPNFFKRSLKKSSKKSSSNLDASFSGRPNSILKRQQSAVKTDRKNSII